MLAKDSTKVFELLYKYIKDRKEEFLTNSNYQYDSRFINLVLTRDDISETKDIVIKAIEAKLHNFKYSEFKKGKIFLSFEGIDATGKGTLSTLMETFLKENTNYIVNRINIPNYNLESGKIIKECLSGGLSNEELYKRRYEFANHFAVNRKEVQYRYNLWTEATNSEIIIFDRWINSSIAFSVAKTLLHYNITKIEDLNKNLIAQQEVNNIIEYILNLELKYFDNDKVNQEYIITSNIDIIQKRISDRNKFTQNKDNDIIKDDSHEKNLSLLKLTNEVYTDCLTNASAKHSNVIYNNGDLELALINCIDKLLYD